VRKKQLRAASAGRNPLGTTLVLIKINIGRPRRKSSEEQRNGGGKRRGGVAPMERRDASRLAGTAARQ
jgi:hypothetical protein